MAPAIVAAFAFALIGVHTEAATQSAPGKATAPLARSPTSLSVAAPIDHAHALSVIAEFVAGERSGKGDSPAARWRRRFNAAAPDAKLARDLSTQIESAFSDLPVYARAHLLLGEVSCRGDDCEMLAVVNGAVEVRTPNGSREPHAAFGLNDLADRIGVLPWTAGGGETTFETHRLRPDGYLLYRVVFHVAQVK